MILASILTIAMFEYICNEYLLQISVMQIRTNPCNVERAWRARPSNAGHPREYVARRLVHYLSETEPRSTSPPTSNPEDSVMTFDTFGGLV